MLSKVGEMIWGCRREFHCWVKHSETGGPGGKDEESDEHRNHGDDGRKAEMRVAVVIERSLESSGDTGHAARGGT